MTSLALAGTLLFGLASMPAVALAEDTGDELTTAVEVVEPEERQDEEQPVSSVVPEAAPAATGNDIEVVAPVEEANPADAATADDQAPVANDPQTDETEVPAEPAAAADPSDDQDADAPALEEASDPDPIADGSTFVIESGASNNETQVIDAAGGKTANGTNIQTWGYNASAGQKYLFEKVKKITTILGVDGEGNPIESTVEEDETDADGNPFYWIKRSETEQVLTVQGNQGVAGTNVNLLAKDPSLDGQKWSIFDMGANLFKIVSKLLTADGKELVLDLTSGKKGAGVNVRVWTSNNTEAQRFALLDPNPSVEVSNVTLEDGVYTIAAKKDNKFVADVTSGSTEAGANVRIWGSNGSDAQRMVITSDGSGYYTIGILKSAKVLDVSGGKIIPGANVQQWGSNGSDAQKWSIQQRVAGIYTFVNKKTGLVLDVASGTMAAGTNIQAYRDMGTGDVAAAQQFVLTRDTAADKNILGVGDSVSNTGIYTISPAANTSFVFDIKNASGKTRQDPGGLLQLWTSNGSQAQKFQVELVGDNEYLIRTAASGDYLTDMGADKQLQQKDGNIWKIFFDKGGYFALKNTATGRVLDIKGGKYAAGTALQTHGSNGSVAQHFVFTKTNLVNEGRYFITLLSSGNALDIEGASKSAGANARIWSSNRSDAQKYNLVKVGDFYQIINFNSGHAIVGGGAVDADGYNNVTQTTASTTNNKQLWKVVVGNDGSVEFINVASGKNLFARGTAKESNVAEKDLTGKDREDNLKGRSWLLAVATGWYKQNGHWRYVSDDSRAHFDNDINTKGVDLGHYDVLHDLWLKVNGYVSGSMKSYASKTGYLICASWESCYVGVFKGKANVTTKDNWEPLFGWNCGNGSKNTINQDAKDQAALEGRTTDWQWSPYWDKTLGAGNTSASAKAKLPDNNAWAKKLDDTFAGSRLHHIPNNKMERWFTSVSLTLGYHSTITKNPKNELGKHVSHGCIRLDVNNAKWIYDNIHPGTRCLQVQTAEYK